MPLFIFVGSARKEQVQIVQRLGPVTPNEVHVQGIERPMIALFPTLQQPVFGENFTALHVESRLPQRKVRVTTQDAFAANTYEVFFTEIGKRDHVRHLIAVILANGSTEIVNDVTKLRLQEASELSSTFLGCQYSHGSPVVYHPQNK